MADLKALVKKMAEAKGLGEHWPIIEQLIQLESSWNPATPSQFNTQGTEDSWGLFQLNRMSQGLGTGYSAEQLQNPETNAEIALSKIASVIQGGGTIHDALGDWVNARNEIFQGGVAMAGETTGSSQAYEAWRQQAQDEWEKANAYFESQPADGAMPLTAVLDFFGYPAIGDEESFVAYRSRDLAERYSFGESAEAPTAPSPQAVAVEQQALDIDWATVQADMQEKGIKVAAQNLANQIAVLQEGRKTAEYAQDYASRVAPPGMTTVPFTGPTSAVGQLQSQIGMTPSPAIPLPRAPATDPYQALGQAQQLVPQSPNLQFQAPALPQTAPNLAGMSGFPQQMGGAALPPSGESDWAGQIASLREAMRMLFGQVGGMFNPGAQLPIGGR